MSEDRRAVLEGVAYGSDPKVTPADRLRALDMLAQLPGGGAAHDPYGLAHLTGEELDRELEGFLSGPSEKVVDQMVAHRAARLVEESQEWAEVERRVNERAKRLAAGLYVDGGLAAAQAAASAEDDVTGAQGQGGGQGQRGQAAESEKPSAFTADDLPEGISFADLQRGFRRVDE